MVAVFTGTGLGLFNSSYTQLGGASGGSGRLGQSNSRYGVNLANGNLVLQDIDETILTRGLPVSMLRTYNSQGTVAGQGQDGWMSAFESRVGNLTGTANTAGSTLTRYLGDGSQVLFVYDVAQARYFSTSGEGAHDEILWDATAGTAYWIDHTAKERETYDANGRLTTVRNMESNASYTLSYNGSGRLFSIVSNLSANADGLYFAYDEPSGRLTAVVSRENGLAYGQTWYDYDTLGRLKSITTDLTPDLAQINTTDQTILLPARTGANAWNAADADSNNGNLFRTVYTYESDNAPDNLRITGVSYSDGASLSIEYQDGKVSKTIVGSGASAQITEYTYGTQGPSTTLSWVEVKDGSNRRWQYGFDGVSNELRMIVSPPVDNISDVTSYVYDGQGNVVQVKAERGSALLSRVDYEYDAMGNVVKEWDLLGNRIDRVYNTLGMLLNETRYTTPDPDGASGPAAPSSASAMTTRYAYSGVRLTYVVTENAITGNGEVTEYVYGTGSEATGGQGARLQVIAIKRYVGVGFEALYYAPNLGVADPLDAYNLWQWTLDKAHRTERTDFRYDTQGRLQEKREYAQVAQVASSGVAVGDGILDAATNITRYTYDAQGLLRQQITQRGSARTLGASTPQAESEIVDYVYDGMGRLLSTLRRKGDIPAMPDPRDPANAAAYANWQAAYDASTVLTTYNYLDSGNTIKITTDTGMTRTEVRNANGQLVAVTESNAASNPTVTRTSSRHYDAAGRLVAEEDASGARSYFIYDAKGRLSAMIDATGAVAQTMYDGADRVIETRAYANRVTPQSTWWDSAPPTSLWRNDTGGTAPAGALVVTVDATRDVVTQRTYDGAGRIATETVVGVDSAQTQKTTYTYDAAHQLLQVSITDGASTAATARTTRYIYDKAGRQVGIIDAQGYLTEYAYDLAGRVFKKIRYFLPAVTASGANVTIDDVRPAMGSDLFTYNIYDGRGNLIGELDSESYLTEFVYDEAGNQRATKRYAAKVGLFSGEDGMTAYYRGGTKALDILRTSATSGLLPGEPGYRLTQRNFNALGQLVTELNHEGTTTQYTYDEAGRLVKTATGNLSSEIREGNLRFDVFGNLIGELSGEGSIHLLAGMSESQLDAVYAQYGVTHSYDLVGRRTESIDAAGNKTWYFYDGEGRQTFVVKGQRDSANILNAKGEVTETRYDAFGHVIDSIAYTGAITIGVPGSRASVQSAISTLSVLGNDSRTQFSYDRRGLLIQRTDAEGYNSRYTYNSFGELATQQDLEANGSTVRRTTSHAYDTRGQLTTTNENGGGLERAVSTTYDAFGRTLTRTDARNQVTNFTYDRLGRVLTQSANIGGRNEAVSMTYDAYGRTVTQTDALGNVTTYAYSDANRSMTITTPEGVSVTTARNRFGQTVSVSQSLPGGSTATTTTVYDKNGQITSVTDPLGKTATNSYDVRGLLTSSVDETGRRVEYSYDAVGRVLTRREDPTGLNLTTTYAYDGQGRQLQVTDASGRVTTMAYDRKGNLTDAVQDPAGLNLRTKYTWDRDGRQLTVTEGDGTGAAMTTAYEYDALGRRTKEVRGSGSLNLTTTYAYDANNNVVSKMDGSGRVVRYAYDAANRLRFTLDAMSGITEVAYDAAGRVTMTRRYAKVGNAGGLPTQPSEADLQTHVQNQAYRNDALDEVTYRVHDRDGRARLSIDGTGAVREMVYDSAGRVLREVAYVKTLALGTTLRDDLKAGTTTVSSLNLSTLVTANDAVVRHVYDVAGQRRYSVDATGAVNGVWYDAAGRVVATRVFSQRLSLSLVTDAVTQGQIDSAMGAGAATDAVTLYVYDGAGRARYTLRANGDAGTYPASQSVTETRYDAAGRVLLMQTYVASLMLDLTTAGKIASGNGAETDLAAFVAANPATAQNERRVYDAAGRMQYTIDGTGAYVRYRYDASSRLVVMRKAVTPLNLSTITDATTAVQLESMVVEAPGDEYTNYMYDAAGRLRYTVRAVSSMMTRPFVASLTQTRYDGADRVLATVAYTTHFTVDETTVQKLSAGTAVDADFSAFVTANAGAAQTTRTVYDAAGRMQYTIDGIGAYTRYRYDGADRVVVVRRALTPLNLSTITDATTAVQLESIVVSADGDEYTNYVYDAAGRQTYTVKAVGSMLTRPYAASLTQMRYDGAGRVLSTHAYTTYFTVDEATVQAMSAGIATDAYFSVFTAANADTAQTTRTVYDASGNARYAIDALGYVTQSNYDGAGRLQSRHTYRNAITLTSALTTKLDAGTATDADIATAAGAASTVAPWSTGFDAASSDRLNLSLLNPGNNGTGKIENGRLVFTRTASSQAPAQVWTNGVSTLSQALTYRVEVTTDASLTNNHLLISLSGTTGGVQREGIHILNGTLYKHEYLNGSQVPDSGVALGSLSANMTYVVEIVTADDSVTTYIYAKGASRTSGWSFSRAVTSAAFGGFNLLMHTDTSINGAPVSVDNLAILNSNAVASESYRYNAAGQLIAKVDGLGDTETYRYDASGRRVSMTDANGNTTRVVYDSAGRARYEVDALGYVTQSNYDGAGRLQSRHTYRNAIALTSALMTKLDAGTATDADIATAAGAASTVAPWSTGFDGRTIAGLNTASLDPQGTSAGRIENGRLVIGRVAANGAMTWPVVYTDATYTLSDAQTYRTEITTDSTHTNSSLLLSLRNAADSVNNEGIHISNGQLYAYRGSAASGTQFTLLGNLETSKTYVVEIETTATGITTYIYAKGQTRADGYSVTRSIASADYGAFRLLIHGTSEVGVSGANLYIDNHAILNSNAVASESYRYNAAGQLIAKVDGLGNTETYTYDAAGRRLTVTDASGNTSRVVYDKSGQQIYNIDATGAFTRTWYNAAGQVVAVRKFDVRFDAAILSDAVTGEQLDWQLEPLGAWTKAYVQEFRVYDAAGQLQLVYDSAAYVTQYEHDAAGRLTNTRRYASQFVSGDVTLTNRLFAGLANYTDFTAFLNANESSAQMQSQVYDPAGRVRYALQRNYGQWSVSEQQYDGVGRTTAQTQYGVTISYTPGQSEAQVIAAIQSQLSTDPAIVQTQARTTRYLYDAAGQKRFVLDATFAVSEQRYDGAGRVTETRSYGIRPANITIDLATVSNWTVTQSSANVRKVTQTYDVAGRITARTDALTHSERFTYDGAGRVLSRTDRNNAVWQYQYDAAGRKTAEISPQTEVYGITAQGVLSVQTRSIVTRYSYDALGQVLSKSEDADGANSRTTRYSYDTRGLLIRTTLPHPGAIDPVTGNLVFTGPAPTVETTYNALGQAVVQKDVNNNYSYKTYDALGRVSAEVDQESNVSTYLYNAYGEQTLLSRYAAALNTTASAFTTANWQAGQPISWAQIVAGVDNSNGANRAINTVYNQLGQKSEVTLSAVEYRTLAGNTWISGGTPTTRYEYNAYGEVVKERVLQSGSTDPNSGGGFWAETYRYYDAAGRMTHVVDAEGYLTTSEYNATGEMVKTIEYARAVAQRSAPSNTPGAPVQSNYSGSLNLSTTTPPGPPAAGDATTGYNRETQWTYDVLGRKLSETAFRHVRGTDGSVQQQPLASSYGYDAEDRVTSVTNASGVTTTTYNALGRAISVREPSRLVLADTADAALQASTAANLASSSLYATRSPYTTVAYDGFGRVIASRRHANGHDGVNPPAIDDTRDQVILSVYDALDRVVMSQSAMGWNNVNAAEHRTYSAYDAAGKLVHSWLRAEGSTDARDAMVHRWYSYDKTGRQTGASQTRAAIGSAASSGTDQADSVGYNAFGEIVRKTHEGFSDELLYTYDNAGQLTSDNGTGAIRKYAYNLAGQQIRESHWVKLDATSTAVEVATVMTVDGLGRTTKVVLPTHTADAAGASTMLQSYDRWGNLTRVVDARGYQSDFEYNDQNQLVKEIRPLAWVVAENGAGSWQRPVHYHYYDVQGRRIGTRDANGNLRQYSFDNVGQQVAMTNGSGNIIRHAYDTFGRQRMTEDALGHITWQAFDQGDQVTSIGDFLTSGAARTRHLLQSYALNQNGNRLTVTNALNETAKYDYDGQGHVIRSETAMGVWLEYGYDVMGRKVLERNALSHGSYQPDVTEAAIQYDSLSWKYDVFGRAIDHDNLSGRDSDYEYDALSGMLMREVATGGPAGTTPGVKKISYYHNGRVREVLEYNSDVPNPSGPPTSTYRYEYDSAGNRTMEYAKTSDVYGLQVQSIARTVYDSNNRILRVTQDDVNDAGTILKRNFELRYDYDANGNRRRVVTQSGYGPNLQGVTSTNQAPVVSSTPRDRGVRPGEFSQFRLLFNDVFRDAENDALTLTIAQANGSALPSWLTVSRDAQTGEIVFTANVPAGTPDTDIVVKLSVHETGNAAQQASTTFVVRARQNHAPEVLQGVSTELKATVGQLFAATLSASDYFTDLDVNEQMTLSLSGAALPAWLSVDTTGGRVRLQGMPPSAQAVSITLRATDSRGAYVERTIQLVAQQNMPPIVVASPGTVQASIGHAFTWTVPVSQIFTDPNGDILRIGAVGLPAWVSFEHQSGTNPPQLKITGQVPPSATNGQVFVITLTATEPSGASVTTTLQLLTTNNLAPSAPIVDDKSIKQNVAYNLTLPEFYDQNGDTLTYSMTGLPPGLSFNPNSRLLSGTPTAPGPWTVTYQATDGGQSTAMTFTILVQANTVPNSVAVSPQNAGIGVNALVSLPAFNDPDGDTLTYSISNLPPGLAFDATNRRITGSPTTLGSWTVTYSAADGRGGVASTQFVYTISTQAVNQPPQLMLPLQDGQAEGSLAFNYQIPLGAFVDPEGYGLTYSYSIVSSDMSTAWLYFNAGNRTFSGTPHAAADGTIVVRVTATDNQGATAYDDFVVSVIPHQSGNLSGDIPPPIGGETEGASYTFDMGMEVAPFWDGGETGPAYGETSSASSSTPLPPQVQDKWFTYDAENRLRIGNGVLSGAAGAAGTTILLTMSNQLDSYEHGYDAAGRITLVARRRVNQYGQDTIMVQRSVYDLRGQRQYEFHMQTLGTSENGIAKQFSYDAVGRLVESRSYYAATQSIAAPLDGEGLPRGHDMSIGGWLSDAEQQSYDADGRLLWQRTLQRTSQPTWRDPDENVPNAAEFHDLGLLTIKSRVDYTKLNGSSGYDAAGRLEHYRYSAGEIEWNTHFYDLTYEGWDSWQEKKVEGSSPNNYKYRATTNTLTYDHFGRLIKQLENTPLPTNYGVLQDRLKVYTYTGDATIITRREGTLESNNFTQVADSTGAKANYLFIHASGRQQAEIREGGSIRTANSTYSIPQITTLNGGDPYRAGGSMVVVLEGETLATLAQRIYGTDMLWYTIADANGMGDRDAKLVAGTQLKVPEVSVNQNDAGTFKPYDPNDAIGGVIPSLPYILPPPGPKCGALVRILSIIIGFVVQAVVTYYSGNAQAGGAAGGASANLSYQGLTLMANGEYDWGRFFSFMANPFQGNSDDMVRSVFDPLGNGAAGKIDYEQVAIAAVAGAAGSWLGSLTSTWGAVASTAVSAATSYTVTYGLNKELGNDVHFSLREMGVAMATAVAAQAIGDLTGANGFVQQGPNGGKFSVKFSWGQVAKELTASVLTSAANYGIKKAFGVQATWNWGDVAVDAAGAMAGSALAAPYVAANLNRQAQRAAEKAQFEALLELQGQEIDDIGQALFDLRQGSEPLAPSSTIESTTGPVSDIGGGSPFPALMLLNPAALMLGVQGVQLNAPVAELETITVTSSSVDEETDGYLDELGLGFVRKWDANQRYNRTVGGGGMLQTFNTGSSTFDPDFDYGGTSKYIDAEALRLFSENPVAQSNASVGFATSLLVQATGDAKDAMELAGKMMLFKQGPAAEAIDRVFPNPVSKWIRERNKQTLTEMGAIAENLPEFVKNLPEYMSGYIEGEIGKGNHAFNQGRYTEAFYHYGKIAYPVLTLAASVIPGGGAAIVGARVAQLAVKTGLMAKGYAQKFAKASQLASRIESPEVRLRRQELNANRDNVIDPMPQSRPMTRAEIRIRQLDQEGHGPARHGGPNRVSDQQLRDRALHKYDPVTGTRYDAYKKNPDGTPALHSVGRNASAFVSDDALVVADDFIRNSADYTSKVASARASNAVYVQEIDVNLIDIFGPNYRNFVRGHTRLGPVGTGSLAPIDFTGGYVRAYYRLDNGVPKLHTIYPNPVGP